MILLSSQAWKIAAGALAVCVAASVVWAARRRRPTPDEMERMRRRELARTGRLVDGMLLDLYEANGQDGSTRSMMVYSYRIGGVDYECSQDITALLGGLAPGQIKAGFPCTVRYRQGGPQNSIVLAEEWSGLHTPAEDEPGAA